MSTIMDAYFRISVRGTEFTTSSASARDFMDTLTRDGQAETRADGSYFVDRNPAIFHHVLDYFSGKNFHLPKGICAIEAREEMEFWMIPLDALPKCCYEVLYNDNLSSYDAIENMEERLSVGISPKEGKCSSESKLQKIRETLNKAVMEPSSNLLGKIWLFLVATCTLTTIVCFLLNMHSEFRVPRGNIPKIPDNATYNAFLSNPKRRMLILQTVPTERFILEMISNVFLTVDLFFRFIITHRKKAFVLNTDNLFQFIACVFSFVVSYADKDPQLIVRNKEIDNVVIIIGGLYTLRVLILLRIAETTSEMKILKLCFQKSWKIIALLFMVFTIFSVIFGSAMFWSEFDNADTFPNVFISIWWAVVTITTVGYGDHYPKTPFGYIMASVTALCGLLLIAMPIAALSSNFSTYYNCYNYKKKYTDAKKRYREKSTVCGLH